MEITARRPEVCRLEVEWCAGFAGCACLSGVCGVQSEYSKFSSKSFKKFSSINNSSESAANSVQFTNSSGSGRKDGFLSFSALLLGAAVVVDQ